MGLSGQFFKMQVNGSSGWAFLDVDVDASPSITKNTSDITQHGDDGVRRLALQVDGTIDITVNASDSDPAIIQDLQDAALATTDAASKLDIEWSPDGHASGGPTDVYSMNVIVESFDQSAPSDDAQQYDFSMSNADGNAPSVARGGSFSV